MSTTPAAVPAVTLNDGRMIPQLGLGVWQIPDEEATAAVRAALDAGYRLVDTAAIYRNELGVGRGLRESGLPRGDVVVTTKVWNSEHGYERTIAACRASLERLGLDHVDLYLIHWPVPRRDAYVETWRALVALREEGLARSIGVSNFTAAHLARLVDETGVVPAVNQVELHPRFQQAELRAEHARLGVVTEAWSPLAQGELLSDPVICAIAGRLGVSAAQVIIRWHLDLGNVVIPKTVKPARMAENLDVFGFTLAEEDLAAIAALERGARIGPDPDTF
jgi:2,5-diketo-D-gluconate reductase A